MTVIIEMLKWKTSKIKSQNFNLKNLLEMFSPQTTVEQVLLRGNFSQISRINSHSLKF